MPSYQDLPVGVYIDRVVPEGAQPWVVSYSWSALLHLDPNVVKICQRFNISRKHVASETDLAFVDYMRFPNGGGKVPLIYSDMSTSTKSVVVEDGMVELPDRSPGQTRQFNTGLAETTCVYAFSGGNCSDGTYVKGCKVLVLGALQDPKTFPERVGMRERESTYCDPLRRETLAAWGFCKSAPYERGCWTCAEFSVARLNSNIANYDDVAVQKIDVARSWPNNVKDYAEMMDTDFPPPVFSDPP